MTTVKILNNGKIHKLSQLPQTFSSLQDSIKLILHDTLPNSYILQYEDLEGDHVMLASEEDYAAMLLTELPKDPSKSLRVHVVSRDKPETGYNKEQFYCGIQGFVESDNKDIHEQIQEGANAQNLNVKPHLKPGNNEEILDSSDEEEKDYRSRDDFDGRDKKYKYGDFDKDELKKQKKMMKKEIKVQRAAKKVELLKDAITEALFDNLPTIAKVVKAYVDDPAMNLEETVQNVRPKTTLASQLEDHEGLQAHFKRPFLMFRSLIDVYRGLTDEQKTETNKLLGGIPEKLLTGDHEKTKEGGPPGPWGGPGAPWGGPGGHWGGPGPHWGGPGGPWGGPGGWGNKFRKGGDWNSEKSEEQSQEGKWRHKHHHHHGYKGDKSEKYEKKDKKDKFEGAPQEGWKKKGREGGYEDKERKREKKDWRAKEEENVGSEFNMELVKEVGTVPPKVSVSDGTIYKTVIIKNTGTVEWPRSALLVPRGEIKGENVRLTNVKPGQEYTPVLVLKGPGKVGSFVTEWKLAYKDEQGKNYFTGASINVGLNVVADS